MIEPSKVKEAFNRIEAENYAFRAYLKNHADEDELDEQFLKLHKELFLSYDCSKCRNCCKEYSASFEEDELGLISAFLKMTEKDFIDKYIKEEFGGYQLNVKPCCFLKKDGGCEIEEVKTLNLHSSFSGNVNIENVGNLILKSSYDKVSIGEADSINGSTQFSGFSLQNISKSIKMKTAYGSFKVYSIATDFELVDIDSEFCSLKLYVDPASNFIFYTDVQLGSFNYPKDKVTVTNFQKDVTDLMVEGYFGSRAKAKGNMRLSVDNASVNINIK